jgi:wyosine [tRNA(Phe)-imidazoG37] synthetase (radical SAM superfamily)
VQSALSSHAPGEIDWITFVGSGETTLHAGIGWLIGEVKKITNIPVAVITNGSLLFISSVRDALAAADAVLPSLDAGTPELYKTINRPHPYITYERYIQGLITFREEFRGKFWLEVMLVQGLNDTREALEAIAGKMALIKPDKIHIGIPYRPPVEVWVQVPDESAIMRATSILGEVAEVVHPQEGRFDLEGGNNIVDGIIGVITRHPMSDEQLHRSLANYPLEKRSKIIAELKASPRAKVVKRYGNTYWCAATTVFPDAE